VSEVPALARTFSYLSLLSLGGGIAAYLELMHLTVDVQRWLTESQVDYLYSVGQLAPGPNMMMIASIGQWVAGLPGAAVAIVAFLTPTAILAFVIGRVWIRLQKWPSTAVIQRGLRTVSIGLLLAGCITFGRGAVHDRMTALISVVAFAVILRSRINPAFVVLIGALVGVLVYGQA
jgi:chromate transporter